MKLNSIIILIWTIGLQTTIQTDRDRRDRPRIRVPNLLRDRDRRRNRGGRSRRGDRGVIDRRDRDHRRDRNRNRDRDRRGGGRDRHRRRSRSRSRGRRSRSKGRGRDRSKDRKRRDRSKSRDRSKRRDRSKHRDDSKDRDRKKRSRSRHRHRSRSRDRRRRSRSSHHSKSDKTKSDAPKSDTKNANDSIKDNPPTTATEVPAAPQTVSNETNSDAQSAVPATDQKSIFERMVEEGKVQNPDSSTQPQPAAVIEHPQPAALPEPADPATASNPNIKPQTGAAANGVDGPQLLNTTAKNADNDMNQNLDDTEPNNAESTAPPPLPPPCTAGETTTSTTTAASSTEMKSNATTAEEEDPHSIHAQLLQSRDDPAASRKSGGTANNDNDSDDDIDRRDIERRRQVDYDKFAHHQVTVEGENVPPAIELFSECLSSSDANKPLLDNLEREQFSKPTPIQKHCLPLLLENRDVMAIAQTGSGKTLAFLLPIVAQLLLNGEVNRPFFAGKRACAQPLALIMAPTRELTIQIDEQVYKVK